MNNRSITKVYFNQHDIKILGRSLTLEDISKILCMSNIYKIDNVNYFIRECEHRKIDPLEKCKDFCIKYNLPTNYLNYLMKEIKKKSIGYFWVDGLAKKFRYVVEDVNLRPNQQYEINLPTKNKIMRNREGLLQELTTHYLIKIEEIMKEFFREIDDITPKISVRLDISNVSSVSNKSSESNIPNISKTDIEPKKNIKIKLPKIEKITIVPKQKEANSDDTRRSEPSPDKESKSAELS